MVEESTNDNHIAAVWRIYEEKLMPVTAGPTQRKETKRAFYTAAILIVDRLVDKVSDDPEMTEADNKIFVDIHTEYQTFLDDMRAGRA